MFFCLKNTQKLVGRPEKEFFFKYIPPIKKASTKQRKQQCYY